MIARVVTLWDFVPIGLAIAGCLGVSVLTLGFLFSHSRPSYFRRWRRHFAALALAGVCGGLWHSYESKRMSEAYRRAQLYREIREIELASYIHFSEQGLWPTGSNQRIIQLLSTEGPTGKSILALDRINLSPEGAAIDPWGSDLLFELTEKNGLKVRSIGPDRTADTKDDLPREPQS